MTLKTSNFVLSPQLPEKRKMMVSVSGTIDTLEELEVFDNAVGSQSILVIPSEGERADGDEPYCVLYIYPLGLEDWRYITCYITIGSDVSWTIHRDLTDDEVVALGAQSGSTS